MSDREGGHDTYSLIIDSFPPLGAVLSDEVFE